MTDDKLLNRLGKFFDAKKKERAKQCDDLTEVLKKLEKREKALKRKMAEEKDAKKHKALEKMLRTLSAQRKKGAKMCKDLTS